MDIEKAEIDYRTNRITREFLKKLLRDAGGRIQAIACLKYALRILEVTTDR